MRQGELAGMPEPAALRLLAADGQVLVTHGRTLVYRYEADDTGMRNLAIVALTDAGRRIDEVALLFGLTATYVSMLRGRTALAGPAAKHRHVGRGEPKEEGHLVDPAAGVGQCHDRQVAHPGVVRLVPVNQRPPVGHQYLPIGCQKTQRGRLRHPRQLALSHAFSLSQSQRILDDMARRRVLLTGHFGHYLRRSETCVDLRTVRPGHKPSVHADSSWRDYERGTGQAYGAPMGNCDRDISRGDVDRANRRCAAARLVHCNHYGRGDHNQYGHYSHDQNPSSAHDSLPGLGRNGI